MPLTAIILAAGRSTRMQSSRPKPLHEVCGRPMLRWIVDACFDAGCGRIIVVVGHGKDEVIAAMSGDPRLVFVEQGQQLGTGHAVRVCRSELEAIGQGEVLILAGDTPLVRGEVLRTLRQAHLEEKAAASMATAVIDDPTGYGRVVRDESGRFLQIVEHADATPQQRQIREVFPSYYCVEIAALLAALDRLTNHNAKGEYYLTDIYAILRGMGRHVAAVEAVSAEDVLAPNTRQQLAEADAAMQERLQRQHRDSGVTIVSSSTTYIEAGAMIGVDTVIRPFTFIGRDSTIGSHCTIGPFALVPAGSIVPDGSSVEATAAVPLPALGSGPSM